MDYSLFLFQQASADFLRKSHKYIEDQHEDDARVEICDRATLRINGAEG
jgi:hypothetical protein